MNLIWREDWSGCWFATRNGRAIGMVVCRNDGTVTWKITAVHTKWVVKGYGDSKDVICAKRSLTRAWKIWCEAHGLGEKI